MKRDWEEAISTQISADFRRLEEKIFNANEEGMERECSQMACLESLNPLSLPYLFLFNLPTFYRAERRSYLLPRRRDELQAADEEPFIARPSLIKRLIPDPSGKEDAGRRLRISENPDEKLLATLQVDGIVGIVREPFR